MGASLQGAEFDVAAAALGGLLGSVHCVGMCGGLAATCCASGGAGPTCVVSHARMVLHSMLFTAGRIFTYMFLGMAAASFGASLFEPDGVGVVAVQKGLSLLAGAALVVVGLSAVSGRPTFGGHLLVRLQSSAHGGPTRRQGGAASNAGSPGTKAFFGGVGTGFLPCGLVYAVVVLAASSPSPIAAGLLMGSFGAGTAPLMVLSGYGGLWLSPARRGRWHGFAGAALALLGLATIARGLVLG